MGAGSGALGQKARSLAQLACFTITFWRAENSKGGKEGRTSYSGSLTIRCSEQDAFQQPCALDFTSTPAPANFCTKHR